MAINLTKEVLRTCYSLLRMTRPFDRWHLPPACDVVFKVLRTKDLEGDYYKDKKKRHVIRVSAGKCHTLHAVILVIAHEMCHMRDSSKSHHGAAFNRLADSVCRWHHFDRGQF